MNGNFQRLRIVLPPSEVKVIEALQTGFIRDLNSTKLAAEYIAQPGDGRGEPVKWPGFARNPKDSLATETLILLETPGGTRST